MAEPLENMPVTHRRSIYPGIDPAKYVGTLTGKVVFITGASRGIGEAVALAFAKAGASLFLASRKQDTLDKVVADLEAAVPEVKVGTAVTDVVDHNSVKEAFERCVEEFGGVDVVISNSGAMEGGTLPISEVSPPDWWRNWEVNVLGSFNVAHYALPLLRKTKGYFMFVSSAGAQKRRAGASAYQTSKHAINRIAEYAHMENEGVKVFAVHPGGVITELSKGGGPELTKILKDDVNLCGAAMVRLVQGQEDWLSGRYVSVCWDLDELAKYKETILKEDALKNRLALPSDAY